MHIIARHVDFLDFAQSIPTIPIRAFRVPDVERRILGEPKGQT